MIIFFDWDHDGTSDHVGIVEKCEGGRVYTVEGNSSDQVRQRNYAVDYASIMGYGVMSMPALMIDDKIVSAGKVLKAKDVEKLM